MENCGRFAAATAFALVDAYDPLPSWNDIAREIGIEPPCLAPDDVVMNVDLAVALYWPVVTCNKGNI